MSSKKINVVDLTDKSDWFIVWSEGMKNHWVHKCLLSPLIADLESRGAPVFKEEPTDKVYHEELGGWWIMGRPEEIIKLDLLNIRLPSRDVDLALERVLSLPRRSFANGEVYFKLKSKWGCIVLTEEQQELLIEGLAVLLEQAAERDGKFMEGWKDRQKKKK